MKREGMIELLRRKFERDFVPCSPDLKGADNE
jgi:hypothetical protein